MITIRRPPPPVEGKLVVRRSRYELGPGEERFEVDADWVLPAFLRLLRGSPPDFNSPSFAVGAAGRRWFFRIFCGHLSLICEPNMPAGTRFSFRTLGPGSEEVPGYAWSENDLGDETIPVDAIIFGDKFLARFLGESSETPFTIRAEIRSGESERRPPELGRLLGSAAGPIVTVDVDGTEFRVTFSTSPPGCRTRTFQAHAAVLSAASPVFAAMFGADMRESREGRVALPETTPAAVAAVLGYCYGERARLSGPLEQAAELARLAHRLQIPTLLGCLEAALSGDLSRPRLPASLGLSRELGMRRLEKLCNDFVASHGAPVDSDSGDQH